MFLDNGMDMKPSTGRSEALFFIALLACQAAICLSCVGLVLIRRRALGAHAKFAPVNGYERAAGINPAYAASRSGPKASSPDGGCCDPCRHAARKEPLEAELVQQHLPVHSVWLNEPSEVSLTMSDFSYSDSQASGYQSSASSQCRGPEGEPSTAHESRRTRDIPQPPPRASTTWTVIREPRTCCESSDSEVSFASSRNSCLGHIPCGVAGNRGSGYHTSDVSSQATSCATAYATRYAPSRPSADCGRPIAGVSTNRTSSMPSELTRTPSKEWRVVRGPVPMAPDNPFFMP